MEHLVIKEPLLQFGNGMHICPRAGINMHNVFDVNFEDRKKSLSIGVIGIDSDIQSYQLWLQRCKDGIECEPETTHPKLKPSFLGLNTEFGFCCEFNCFDRNMRTIPSREIKGIAKLTKLKDRIETTIDLYHEQIKFLSQSRNVDCIVCIIPEKLINKITGVRREKEVEDKINGELAKSEHQELDFRRALKAKCLYLGCPLQLVRAKTFEQKTHGQQDDATIAWNLCTAIYYKASRTVPWRLPADGNNFTSCFVGISFYRSRDKSTLNTSLAQIFDEMGNSVILRGTPVEQDKDDRRPFLNGNQAESLLKQALDEYKIAMGNLPSRLVLHKSSVFREEEKEAFEGVVNVCGIQNVDFVTIRDSSLRLFRKGLYPPFRGTYLNFNEGLCTLYTRGSIDYYETYPGLYIPEPIEIDARDIDMSPIRICEEILALTKMNWNNTQFDGKYPITLECARRVGMILKYLDLNDRPQISYSYYM